MSWRSDGPDEFEDDDTDDPTAPCPHCLRPIYDDAERCPACGAYLSREDAPRRGGWWLWLGAAAGLLAVLTWCMR